MHTLEEILLNIGCEYTVVGELENFATNFASLFESNRNSVCWMRAKGDEAISIVQATPFRILICNEIDVSRCPLLEKTLIFVGHPQVAYMRLLRNTYSYRYCSAQGVHPTAIVSPDACIGSNVSIGPFVTIGECIIGDNCIIKSHSVVHDGAKIGSNVLISEHCNIGGEGFGYIKNEIGELENMLHIGSVVIEDDVSIFPYTNVDRATLGETIVGRGTKVDHYCHIGHNSKIGSNNVITPNVSMMGGTQIGNECIIGSGTAFRDGVRVGDYVTIGMSSVVTKNIPDHQVWVGSPARPIQEFKLLQRRIAEMLSIPDL